MKKLLIAFLTYTLVMVPIKQAQAAIDWQNAAGTTLLTSGSLLGYMEVAAIAAGGPVSLAAGAALGLGTLGAALLFTDITPTTAHNNQGIKVNLNPKMPLITPPGWTSGTSSSVQPVPPSSSSFKPSGTSYGSNTPTTAAYNITFSNMATYGQTITQTCSNMIGETLPGITGPVTAASLINSNTCQITASNGQYTPQLTVNATTCPTGYAVSGSDPTKTCSLQTPTSVIKPVMGVENIIRSGNTFTVDPQAHPNDKLPANVVSTSSNTVTINDSTGATTTVTINTDGTTKVVVSAPQADGTTKQRTTIFSAPDGTTGDVTVTGTQDQTVNGKGTATGTTPVITSSGTGSNIDISSLNKEVTQAQIKANTDTMKEDIQTIKKGVTNEDNHSTDLQDKKDDYETKAQEHSDKIKSIGDNGLDHHGADFDWFPPIPSASCTPLSAGFGGRTITLDLCPTVAKLQGLFGFVLYIATGYTLFNVFTGRRED